MVEEKKRHTECACYVSVIDERGFIFKRDQWSRLYIIKQAHGLRPVGLIRNSKSWGGSLTAAPTY